MIRYTDRIVMLLEENKAHDIRIIHADQPWMDDVIVATASSSRQLLYMAESIMRYAQDEGVKAKMDGRPPTQWIVVVVGFVFVHLFKAEARQYYNIENIWDNVCKVSA